MKRCPFCAEEIQSEAIKCRFCGEWLPDPRGAEPQVTATGPLSVVYEVVGTSVGASVTFLKPGGEANREPISLPWEWSFQAYPGDVLSLTVHNHDPSGFSYTTANIRVEGRVVKSCTARGRYRSCGVDIVIPRIAPEALERSPEPPTAEPMG